jgi:hypothetical protein
MKKLFTIYTTTLLLTALVVSCGKETKSSEKGGGMCKIRVTVNPPLQPGDSRITDGSSGLNVNFIGYNTGWDNFYWTGNAQTSAFNSGETKEHFAPKGVNIRFDLGIANTFDIVCRQVKVEFLIDNNVKITELLEMGYSQFELTPVAYHVYCKDKTDRVFNFIVP